MSQIIPAHFRMVSIAFFITIFSSAFGGNRNDKKSDTLEFGCNNEFDSLFLYAHGIALSAYPELNNTSIIYKKAKIKTIMAARPVIWTVFNKKDKRKYKIVLSNNPKNNSDSIFCQISKLALIGILGHEYAHLLSYNEMSTVKLAFFGIKYVINKKKIERETDSMAIQRGFGNELLEFNRFVNESKFVSKNYIERRQNYYLSVNEIERINQR